MVFLRSPKRYYKVFGAILVFGCDGYGYGVFVDLIGGGDVAAIKERHVDHLKILNLFLPIYVLCLCLF